MNGHVVIVKVLHPAPWNLEKWLLFSEEKYLLLHSKSTETFMLCLWDRDEKILRRYTDHAPTFLGIFCSNELINLTSEFVLFCVQCLPRYLVGNQLSGTSSVEGYVDGMGEFFIYIITINILKYVHTWALIVFICIIYSSEAGLSLCGT